MLYRSRAPTPPLDKFIEYFWSLSDTPQHARERVLTTGTIELVINLHENAFRIYDSVDTNCHGFSGAMVSGAYEKSFIVETRAHAELVGVHFRPGGAAPFFKAPPGTFSNLHLDLDCLWREDAGRLREMLCEARSPEQRFEILAHALLAHLRPERESARSVHFALDRLERGASVGEVSAQLGVSRRRLIEVFTTGVGMTPKLYARVRRFQRALSSARTRKSWAEIALDCGYYDQSHMIRDFIDLAGESPAQLGRGGKKNVKEHHVPLASR